MAVSGGLPLNFCRERKKTALAEILPGAGRDRFDFPAPPDLDLRHQI